MLYFISPQLKKCSHFGNFQRTKMLWISKESWDSQIFNEHIKFAGGPPETRLKWKKPEILGMITKYALSSRILKAQKPYIWKNNVERQRFLEILCSTLKTTRNPAKSGLKNSEFFSSILKSLFELVAYEFPGQVGYFWKAENIYFLMVCVNFL